MPLNKIIQSYVYHGDKCFYVSTINRESSTPYPIIYAETIAWEYDNEKSLAGKLIHQDEDGKNRIDTHFKICRQLSEHGNILKEDN